jgi:hypothetical protein
MKVAIGIAQRQLEADEGGNWNRSEAIGGGQTAIRGLSERVHQSPSESKLSPLESIRVIPSEGNPMHSDTIRGNQRYSEALRGKHTPAAAQSSEPSTRSM